MKEVWKSIKGYPNYEISNLGRIKRLPHYYRKQTLIMKQQPGTFKYYRVQLSRDGKLKKFLVSRLVALHFLKNPKNLPEVNHKNGDKSNNKVSNLEWCTTSENILHAFRTGLKYMTRGEKCSWSKLTKEQVLDIRLRWKLKMYNMREIADHFKINKTTVWKIIHRKIWRHI